MRAFPRVGAPFITSCLMPVVMVVTSCEGRSNSTTTNETSEVDPATIADQCVAEHNKVRAAVTMPANYPGTWSQLPAMTWSSAVAASAQAWANYLRDSQNCNLIHDDAVLDYGENVAGGTIGYTPARAIADWAAEAYAFDPVYEFSQNWGHYSQIVWRNSTEVGCAMAFCSNARNVIVCRYKPAGNVIGEQPY